MNTRPPIAMAGLTFGRWKVIGFSHRGGRARTYWACICECGKTRPVLGASLRNGTSKSCGCLCKEVVTKGSTTHGYSRHPAYSSYRAMLTRCSNPNSEFYALYGGRGITVCPRWSSFEKFWLDMGPTWKTDHSIDRIDVNGHYEPENCRWATDKQQGANRRNNVIIPTPKGPMMLSEAARQFGVGYNTINGRMRYGWNEADLLLPVTKDNSRRQDNVIIPTPEGPMMVVEAARRFGISASTIFSRIGYGWPETELLNPVIKRRSKNNLGHFVPRQQQE